MIKLLTSREFKTLTFVIISLYLIGCTNRNENNIRNSMLIIAKAMENYVDEHGNLPTDERGQDYAFYSFRDYLKTEKFCASCVPIFRWNHSEAKAEKMEFSYCNQDIDITSESDKIILMTKILENGYLYGIDTRFRLVGFIDCQDQKISAAISSGTFDVSIYLSQTIEDVQKQFGGFMYLKLGK